jgi:RNA polymerase sigma factor (sigma-70 family)
MLTHRDAEDLVLTTITRHADALLRTARRHSLCADDASDAYQRGLEIFLRNAGRLEPDRAAAWLHKVIKHEAMAVRRARQKLVGAEEFDGDAVEGLTAPAPDERMLAFEDLTRAAEALQGLKPQEVRALWLRMEGRTYKEIAADLGWTYTKLYGPIWVAAPAARGARAGPRATQGARPMTDPKPSQPDPAAPAGRTRRGDPQPHRDDALRRPDHGRGAVPARRAPRGRRPGGRRGLRVGGRGRLACVRRPATAPVDDRRTRDAHHRDAGQEGRQAGAGGADHEASADREGVSGGDAELHSSDPTSGAGRACADAAHSDIRSIAHPLPPNA